MQVNYWKVWSSFLVGILLFAYQGFGWSFAGDTFFLINLSGFLLALFCIHLFEVLLVDIFFILGYILPLFLRTYLKWNRSPESFEFFQTFTISLATTITLVISFSMIGYSFRFLFFRLLKNLKGRTTYRP